MLTLPSRASTETIKAVACDGDRLAEERAILQQPPCRGRRDCTPASNAARERLDVADAAAGLDWRSSPAATMLATMCAFACRPSRAPSRSTTWMRSAPCSAQRTRDVYRVVLEDGLARVVALRQADALAAADVDCGDDLHQESPRRRPRAQSSLARAPGAGNSRTAAAHLRRTSPGETASRPGCRARRPPGSGRSRTPSPRTMVESSSGLGWYECTK